MNAAQAHIVNRYTIARDCQCGTAPIKKRKTCDLWIIVCPVCGKQSAEKMTAELAVADWNCEAVR